ncbi:sensor histidine kinase [Ideonella sp. YS5]|uniref:sensor histidine kinase n=1 Tax=Ideonella sp. YS5 TaxID=3453714 RepID=UPI003EEB174E
MQIRTKGWLVTVTTLAAIVLVGAMTWWAHEEVQDASRQRRQTSDVAQALRDLQLVSFEFMLHRLDRSSAQEGLVWQRLSMLLPQLDFTEDSEAAELADGLRVRLESTHRLFGEFQAASHERVADAQVQRRFEAQLASQLLLMQQDNQTDASLLTRHAAERIEAAQNRMLWVIVGGLLLFALTTAGGAWVIQRDALGPVARLEQATREIAAGNWTFRLPVDRQDEIGQLSRHFNAMTHALRESFHQIEHSNQELSSLNRELESFSYSVSHDLRAPLRSMDGFSLALLEDYGDRLDDEGRDYLKRIRAASQRMGRLIDDLLGLSRVTRAELNLRPVDLSAMAREIADTLAQQQPQRNVRWEIAEGIVAQADRALMQVALQNLLENAWKFTGKTEQAVIRLGARQRDGQLEIHVADNGAGFDMTYSSRLFGAFQRLHHEGEFPGTGIGLATVQRVLRRHGGEVWVEAEPDRGATFHFTIKGVEDEQRRTEGHPAG